MQTNINNVNTGPVFAIFPIHGGRGVESRLTVDGLNISNPPGGNQPPNYTADIGNAAEVTMIDVGRPRRDRRPPACTMNIVPKQGGNTHVGPGRSSPASRRACSRTTTPPSCRRAAPTQPNPVYHVYDFNAAVGGPIVKDKLWYYMSVREQGSRQNTLNVYYNQNAGDPNDVDLRRRISTSRRTPIARGRTTRRASRGRRSQKNKFTFSWDEQPVCRKCTGTTSFSGSPIVRPTSPEADGHGEFSPQRVQRRVGRRR